MIFEIFKSNKMERLSKKFDKEIREECNNVETELNLCMKQRCNISECRIKKNEFDKCVNNFTKKFKQFYRIK